VIINFGNVLIFTIVGVVFVFVAMLLGKFLRPKVEEPDKDSIYECGERPFVGAWFNYNPRFYLIALIFLIFDVEIAFMYPVATVFQEWVANGQGWFAFAEILIFGRILMVGLIYMWKKGDLQWIKSLSTLREQKPNPRDEQS